MSDFLGWIFFGLVVGILAKFLMPGKDPGGLVVTILLGIAGAMLGGWISTQMGFGNQGQSAGWIMSILGSIALLVIYRMFSGSAKTA